MTNYVMSDAAVAKLVSDKLDNVAAVSGANTTYLRALIATTQDTLGIVGRNIRGHKDHDSTTIQTHLDALHATHDRFYAVVQRVAKAKPTEQDDTRDKLDIVASRIVFARSAYSVLRNWILRGKHSLADITPDKATKRGLAEATPQRTVRHAKARARPFKRKSVMDNAQKLLGTILIAAKSDREAAIQALQDAITLLTRGFDDLGLPANDIREAIQHTATGVIKEVSKRLRRAA